VICMKRAAQLNSLLLVVEPVLFTNIDICGRYWGKIRGCFFMQENTLSSRFVGLDERSPKEVLDFYSDKVRG
jgi:hypothetical protein